MLALSNAYLDLINSYPSPKQNDGKLTCVSFFCGGGGLDLGLHFADFDIVYANDLESQLCGIIKHNFPRCHCVASDIASVTARDVFETIGTNKIDLIAGGPPCQAFSILGKRESFDDPRGQLVYEYARIIKEIQPRAFIFENVPGLLTVNKGEDWKTLLEVFCNETGYHLHYKILNAADYGVPQIRRRVFIVGFRDDVLFEFPIATHSNPAEPGILVGSCASWIPAKLALENVEGLPNQDIRIHSARVHNRYETVPQGGRDKTDHTDRIHPEKPSGTVLVGSRAGGGRPFIHPYIPRHITVREAARLQSFPDWYIFQAPNTWQYRAVGNAVPPLLALKIGEQIKKALDI